MHEWGTSQRKITWFLDEDYFTEKYRVVLMLPLYFEEEKPIILLTDRQLEEYKEQFEVYLLKSLSDKKRCEREHITRYIDRFNYYVFQDDRLSPEQGEQLYQYLESCYT